MTTEPDPNVPEPTPEEAQAAFGLPIEHLFTIDPLDITEKDLLLLAGHYRNTRINFMKVAEKPKTVEKSRGPKLDEEATRKAVEDALAGLFGDDE